MIPAPCLKVDMRRNGRVDDDVLLEIDRRLANDACVAIRADALQVIARPGAVADRTAENLLVLVRSPSLEQLMGIVAPGVHAVVEIVEPNDLTGLVSDMPAGTGDIITVSLTTRTIWEKPVGEFVCDLLGCHLQLSEDKDTGLRIALHEAIANAVLHGNLEIDTPNQCEGLEGLDKEYRQMESGSKE